MNCAPTPEYMEAVGRAQAKHGDRWAEGYRVQEEMAFMRTHGDSVRIGLATIEEQHLAVAARYPHLYNVTD
jgi:hypothetical protein